MQCTDRPTRHIDTDTHSHTHTHTHTHTHRDTCTMECGTLQRVERRFLRLVSLTFLSSGLTRKLSVSSWQIDRKAHLDNFPHEADKPTINSSIVVK